MKNVFRVLGIVLISASLLMFMYGSMKTSRAEDETKEVIEIDGIELVQQSESSERAETAFIAGFALFAAGIAVVLFTPSGKRRRK